ncbi:target of rapamycin complex 2 subunit MAPKAP1-like isoform X1 [Varroa jacobsoni]|uniref:Target of rapamycin complex 2 subunit MAPKAP1 n=1 Tax=Varroa destructor TaxID=109461 RepID=A0A7M7KWM5_VARDE|nr:target of rapamycin complex 2 subunit MAPKAP1-like isoform X3 [Varroa destructor]XP_022701332.1 target of rapamycin complex 2 subunit MAPKAP1-like isoform X1 [Varroa jacobsoni]XP_022701338.1 target of rapamycin complex 2 subunit MAPKAP1-like isoform X1 [Varroa jacobsoni]
MALYDDSRFLLSHIRHSFRTADESRMYELAMVTDIMHQTPFESLCAKVSEPPSPTSILYDLYSSVHDPELVQIARSCDIVRDNELVGAHRRRSNTAQRLDKLKKERRLQAKIKRVTLRNPHPSERTELCEGSDIFTPKPASSFRPGKDAKAVTSLLSHLLITKPLPVNPFSQFARLDARGHSSAKTIRVFLPMLPEGERNFPMVVACQGTTRVADLLGLICWQYTSEGRKPELKPDSQFYCLRFAEETGEVEDEFPSVDLREPIGKYEFPSYQMQETVPSDQPMLVLSFHTKDGFSKVNVPPEALVLRDALEELFKRRRGLREPLGSEFIVEKKAEPGVPLDLDAKLTSLNTTEFRIIPDSPSLQHSTAQRSSDCHLGLKLLPEWRMFSGGNFQTYVVQMIQKLSKNVTVQLAISSEKLEITPLPLKTVNKMLWHVKPAAHNMREIAVCELMPKRNHTGKRCFKVVYLDGDVFRDYMFEASIEKAEEIVEQVNCILQMRTTDAQTLYNAEREKKLSRKASFLSKPFG